VDLANPPAGAWYRDEGGEVSVGGNLRTVGGRSFVLVFATFWNGISWTIFLSMLAGSGNISGLGIHHSNGKTDVPWFAFVFITPFLLIGAGTVLAALMLLFGRVEVVIRGQEGTVFTGLGSLGWRRQFDAAAVTGVAIRTAGWTKNNQPQYAVCLEGPTPMMFGSALPEARRQFMAAALRKVLG
jgi:hypothetical protein